MLTLVNRYAHGFVAVPVIVACRRGELFTCLEAEPGLASADLCARLGANPGHFHAALRVLLSLGWLRCEGDRYFLTSRARLADRIPNGIVSLLRLPLTVVPSGTAALDLRRWVDASARRWDVDDPLMADLLDGLLILPLLHILRSTGWFPRTSSHRDEVRQAIDPVAADALRALLLEKGWATADGDDLRPTPTGSFMAERALVTGTTVSYARTLSRLNDLLFGDAAAALARTTSGAEDHVDRTLNVEASGFQHEKFFADTDDLFVSIFDRLPLAEQPRYVIDTGCGDGSFLERIYGVIRSRSARGRALDRHPLTMIGIDYNDEALRATVRRLTGIPHLVERGDIGDPEDIVATLRRRGLTDIERALHVRSFLDHDRRWVPPADLTAVAGRRRVPVHGVHVDRDGDLIPPAAAVQSLVEHLRRWARVTTRHGVVLLEVHCLEPGVVREWFDRTESLHFDAYHAFSCQHLVGAEVFLVAAAEAGLFPVPAFAKKYPRTLPFTRITLNHFEKRPLAIRHPVPADLPALVQLEEACVPRALRAPADELLARLDRSPGGQFVIELGGRVVGAIYSQRIVDADRLTRSCAADQHTLHTPDGPVIQLLGLNVLPDAQGLGLGDQLVEFVLQHASLTSGIERIVGVTRCRSWGRQAAIPLVEHIARDAEGQPADPILRFHVNHGATIEGVLAGFRLEDHESGGHGVLIAYDLANRVAARGPAVGRKGPATTSEPEVPHVGHPDPQVIVRETIQAVLGPGRARAFAPDRPLREIGLDSLDLMELAVLLGRRFGQELEPTFFFKYSTPHAIAAYFVTRRHVELDGLEDPHVPPPILSGREPVVRSVAARGDRATETTVSFGLPAITRSAPRRPDGAEGMREPVAIIGMACRFPGGARTPEAYWAILRDGVDAITDPPADRVALRAVPDARRQGGFLDEVDRFDAAFFRIAPTEAAQVDPQHRLLLETSWEALERAGIDPHALAGSRTGVFTGIFSHDYESLQIRRQVSSDYSAYFATGGSAATASGRIAYFLGLHGPAISIDTACSSSLVAMHLACRSLLDGECDVALAGAVNLILSPELTLAFTRANMLSHDGRCRPFDAAASGYTRSEGCGVVVLERLSRAIANGDPILAVVRGSAINHDGASNGLTAPSAAAQETVIRDALAAASIHAEEVSYIEAHGTGTLLGDPIEASALAAVYGSHGARRGPLALGSVKANIGHAEAAAGMAGLIKVVLSLRRRQLPPQLHFERANPAAFLDRIPAVVTTVLTPWALTDRRPRLAGVSAFGFSGTNAHVILEEPPPEPPRAGDPLERPVHVLTLSAHSRPALVDRVRDLAACLAADEADASARLADICFTANAGRAHFAHRLAFVTSSIADLRAQLDARLANAGAPRNTPSPEAAAPGVVFLFTGQGSQYVGMAGEISRTQPVFRRALDRCDEVLRPTLGISLTELIRADPGGRAPLDHTAYAQPALFAVEYALAELWRSWGITPAALVGHSLGEYVAACVAGVFSLEDALMLVAARGRVMGALPDGGAMAAVFASEADVSDVLRQQDAGVSIAAINGPRSTVISGRGDVVRTVVAACAARGIAATPLRVSHAFHSALMEPILPDFERLAKQVYFQPPRIPLIANLTGEPAGAEIATPDYWCRHLRAPVRFAAAVQWLGRANRRVFLEIGPAPTLIGLARHCLPDGEGVFLPSLRQGQADWDVLLESLAELYRLGTAIDWVGFERGYVRRKVVLPTYPFQRQRYWLPDVTLHTRSSAAAAEERSPGAHPLRGRRLPSCLPEIQYESSVSPEAPAYLAEHLVHDRVVLPSAAYIEMALSAGVSILGSSIVLEDLTIEQALQLTPGARQTLQTVLAPDDRGWRLEVHSNGEAGVEASRWTRHASARLRAAASTLASEPGWTEASARRSGPEATPDEFYAQMAAGGIRYGPTFRAIERLWPGDQEALALVHLPPDRAREMASYGIHPVVLDACLQVAFAARGANDAYMPVAIERASLHEPPGDRLFSYARIRRSRVSRRETFTVDVRMYTAEGRLVAVVDGMLFKRAVREAVVASEAGSQDSSYAITWRKWRADASVNHAAGAPAALDAVRDRLLAERGREVIGADAAGLRSVASSVDDICAASVVRAFTELGWGPGAGEALTAEAIAARGGVAPRYRRLLERLLELLAEDGVVRQIGEAWEWVGSAARGEQGDSSARIGALLRDHPALELELQLLARSAGKLGAVLRGALDPLALLFPDGDLADAGRLYRDGASFQYMNHLVRTAVSTLLAGRPPTGTWRVLEIGGGTGGTAASVLPLLSGRDAEYVFTDVSPSFLTRARQMFRDHSFVRYGRLDIERDPLVQGYTSRRYDLIIAANVLHATRSLRTTLDRIRQLLAPGGTLLLHELTARSRWADLTFGTTDGWWRFDDHDLRPAYPLLDRERWASLLRDGGFADATSVAADEGRSGVIPGQAIILGRRSDEVGDAARSRAARRPGREAGRWLVLADTGLVGEQVASALRAAGQRAFVARAGDRYACLGRRAWTIDPSRREDFERILREPLVRGRAGLRGVIHLLALDATPATDSGSHEMARAATRVSTDALSLVQALVASPGPRLWLVTRGAVAAAPGDRVPGLAQSPLWGLGKVASLEHPGLWGGLIDLDSVPCATEARDICALVLDATSRPAGSDGGAHTEEQIALRDGQCLVPRLTRSSRTARRTLPIRADAAYLITGGFGYLGLQLARWLVGRGARHLVLAGRHPPDLSRAAHDGDDSRAVAVRAIEALGAAVEIVQVDVGDEHGVARLITGTGRPPLRGILHAAGVAGYEPVMETRAEGLAKTGHPKIAGGWLLHRLSATQDLDFFICFSSASSAWGAKGQMAYAAANHFLDALAHHRRGLGLPGLSVNWALIGRGGMLPDGHERFLERIGIAEIPPTAGFAEMERLAASDAVQAVVARVDWGRFLRLQENRSRFRFFAELDATADLESGLPREMPRRQGAAQEAPSRNGGRAADLATYLREQAARTLGLAVADLDVRQPLQTLGFDSLMAMQLKARLQSDLAIDVPMVELMEGFSVSSLTARLRDRLASANGAASQSPTAWVEGDV